MASNQQTAHEEQISLLTKELQKTKAALSDISQVFEEILEGTMAGYWDWDIPNGYEYMSPTFKRMFGYEDSEIPNTPAWWQANIFEEDLAAVYKSFEDHVQSKGKIPYDNVVRYRHKDGSTVWVYCRGKVIEWDEEENPLRMVGSHIDITELKQVQQELQKKREEVSEHESLYRYLYETANEMYASISPNRGLVLKCNNTLCEKLGYNRDEIIGQPVFKLYHPKSLPVAKEAFESFLKNGEVNDVELTLRTRNGRKLNVILNASSVMNDKGELLYSRSSWFDITARKRHEKKERKMMKKLKLKNQEMEQFNSIISHDLNEPIRTIKSITGLLYHSLIEQADEKTMQYLSLTQKSADKMQNLVDAVLNYRRLGSTSVESDVSLQLVLENVIDELGGFIELSEAQINVKRGLPTIEGDYEDLMVLFRNVLQNAIKFVPEGRVPKVDIDLIEDKESVTVSISDNGIGIDSKYSGKVFEMFQQLDFKNSFGGLGIGLAYCRKVMELHNGAIWFEPQEVGTCFYIQFNV